MLEKAKGDQSRRSSRRVPELLGCSPVVVRTKASHRFNQLPKKVPPVAETSRKCLSNGAFSGGDDGSVQIQEGLQLSVAPPATSFWCRDTGCCQKAGGGRSARASLGSLSERLGMGRTGSRTASRLGITHTKQAGLAPRGHTGGRERRHARDQDRTRCSREDLTRQKFQTAGRTGRTGRQAALGSRSRWTDTQDRQTSTLLQRLRILTLPKPQSVLPL